MDITKYLKNKDIQVSADDFDIEKLEKDTDRDNYMSAEEAKKYGLIDKIYAKRQ
jgi:ATP-dependent protease ClpP protease subunit